MGNELCLHLAIGCQRGFEFPDRRTIFKLWGEKELLGSNELAAFINHLFTLCNINSHLDRGCLKELSVFCDLSGTGQLHLNEFLRLYAQLQTERLMVLKTI